MTHRTDPPAAPPPPLTDALLPPDMARKAEQTGVAKARMETPKLLALAVLAGAFISLGAMIATVAGIGAEAALGYGPARLLVGLIFSLGLVLVILGGAELFTGNNLMVMALASRHISAGELARAWSIVYLGNLIGALGTVAMVFLSGQYGMANGAIGKSALAIANAKAGLDPGQAFMLGVLCNVLVCLAVWLCMSARRVSGKILAILFPITAFVAAGFEHSIANMYFIPMGMLIKAAAADTFWVIAGVTPDQFAALGWTGLLGNLIPVTAGNMVGGGILVGAVYWFIYLRVR